jgi:hypothetical protein
MRRVSALEYVTRERYLLPKEAQEAAAAAALARRHPALPANGAAEQAAEEPRANSAAQARWPWAVEPLRRPPPLNVLKDTCDHSCYWAR